MPYDLPWLRRLFAKLAFDVLPAALASGLCGLVFTHYQFDRAPAPAAAQAVPASPAMMQLLRDEHTLMDNFVQAEVNKERQQLAADSAPRTGSDERLPVPAAAAAAATTPRRVLVAAVAAKPAPSGGQTAVVGASLPPLVIARTQPEPNAQSARRTDSLFAKTIGIKDHVVAVTQRVVSALGSLPSWIGAIGDRIGGNEGETPRPPVDLVSAS